MKRRTWGLTVLGLVLASLVGVMPVAGAAETDPASWVPEDALAYVGVPDVGEFWEDFQKTASYKLMTDPRAKDTISSTNMVGEFFKKVKARLAEALEVSEGQLENPFDGPFAFFVTGPVVAGDSEPGLGLVAQVGNKDLMQKYMTSAVAKLKEAADSYESTEAGGHTIHAFERAPAAGEKEASSGAGGDDFEDLDEEWDSEAPGDGGMPMSADALEKELDELFSADSMPENMAVCLADDRLIVSDTVDGVKRILRRERRGGTLAETEDYKDLGRLLRPVGQVQFLINVPQIIATTRRATADDEELQNWLKLLGADAMRSVVGHFRAGTRSYDTKLEALFLMRGERSGLAEMLSMANRPVEPPASIPASTLIYVALNFDPPKLTNQILSMIRQQNPDMATMVEGYMSGMPSPSGEPMNIRREVIDHLRGPLEGAVMCDAPLSAGGAKALIRLAHANRDAMLRLLGMIPAMGGMEPREVRGTQVYGMMPWPPAVAATNDALLIGSTPAVEAALGSPSGESLARTDVFREVKRLVPDEAWFVLFMNDRDWLELTINTAAGQGGMMGGGDPMLGMMLGMAAQEMAQAAPDGDVSKLRDLLGYSSQSLMTICTTPEGVRFTAVQLRPELTKDRQ